MWPHLGADERVDRSTQLQVQNGSARLMLDATTHKKLVGNPGNRPNPVLPSPKKIMVRLWGIIPFYGLKIQVSEIWWYFYPEFGDYSNFIEQGMNVRMCCCQYPRQAEINSDDSCGRVGVLRFAWLTWFCWDSTRPTKRRWWAEMTYPLVI